MEISTTRRHRSAYRYITDYKITCGDFDFDDVIDRFIARSLTM